MKTRSPLKRRPLRVAAQGVDERTHGLAEEQFSTYVALLELHVRHLNPAEPALALQSSASQGQVRASADKMGR